MCVLQVISIPDDDEKSPPSEQESKKNGEEPMETDKPSNGDSEGVKEKEGESEKKSPEGVEETKTEGSEVNPEEPEGKGERHQSQELKLSKFLMLANKCDHFVIKGHNTRKCRFNTKSTDSVENLNGNTAMSTNQTNIF